MYCLVCNCCVGPGTFSDRGCLLFQVGLLTEDLPGRDRVHENLLKILSILGSRGKLVVLNKGYEGL